MISTLKKWFTRTPTYTVKFYMKSGNQIVLHGMRSCTVKAEGNEVTGIEDFFQNKPRGRECLLLNTISLSQIEAVTSTRE